MAERPRAGQIKLPFREAVVTTSLRTGRSEVRVRLRKRYPTPEQEFERAKKANDLWATRGKDAFYRSLRYWGFLRSDISREAGESTNFNSDSIEEGSATEQFLQFLIEARKQQVDPLAIVRRIKSFAAVVTDRKAPEALVLEGFYPEVVDLIGQAYPRMAESKKEALLELLRYQKSLPNF